MGSNNKHTVIENIDRIRNLLRKMRYDDNSRYYTDESVKLLKDALCVETPSDDICNASHTSDHDGHKQNENMVEEVLDGTRAISTQYKDEKEQWTIIGETLKKEFSHEKERAPGLLKKYTDDDGIAIGDKNITLLKKYKGREFTGFAKTESLVHKVKTDITTTVLKTDPNAKYGFIVLSSFPGSVYDYEEYERSRKMVRIENTEDIIKNYVVMNDNVKAFRKTNIYKNGSTLEKIAIAAKCTPNIIYDKDSGKKSYDAEAERTIFISDVSKRNGNESFFIKYKVNENEDYRICIAGEKDEDICIKSYVNNRPSTVMGCDKFEITSPEDIDALKYIDPKLCEIINRFRTVRDRELDYQDKNAPAEREIPNIESTEDSKALAFSM